MRSSFRGVLAIAILVPLLACSSDDGRANRILPERRQAEQISDAPPPSEYLEYYSMVSECLADRGFTATPHDDGISFEFSEAQDDVGYQAFETCRSELEDDGITLEVTPLDDAGLGRLYEALLRTADCLAVLLGIDQERTAPSKQRYVESGGAAWHPYEAVPPDRVRDAEALCPQPR